MLSASVPSLPPGGGEVILAAAIKAIKEESAMLLIGYAVSTATYGISILQVYLYFRNYPKDNVSLKLTVATFWTLDTLSSVIASHALYTLYVLDFENLTTYSLIPWSWALETAILAVVAIMAQYFYAWKIWAVSRNFVVAGFILLISAASFGMGMYISVYLFRFPTLESLVGHSYRSVTTSIECTGLACDVMITTSLIYYLHSRKTEVLSSTQDMIDSLILYVMSYGILIIVCMALLLALEVAYPHHLYWHPFFQLVEKLCVNSVLASLNIRKSVLGKGQPEVSTRSALGPMVFSPNSPSNSGTVGSGSGKQKDMPLGIMYSTHSESDRDV
ncbi:hypothetical protein DFH08DRAFT_156274 [Mycena albidolilacea]|uniref:DUF6534 domain-containing protein n=1 Tax=Mycena albidolilacea TaxID=1033008 RepID=A0AAD7ER65_9AGAR|nr:hypothetical protein DFH08DRAFT_156274 [Mycena albidolilacea]